MSRLLNNNKALLFIIAVLLITNIAMIVFFFCMRPSGKWDDHSFSPGDAMARSLKNEVKFSAEQLKQFDSLRKEHRKEIRPLFKKMNAIKDHFYQHISEASVNDSLLNNGLDSIAVMQRTLDKSMFYHFREVRALCTPEQLPLYDTLVQHLLKRMMNPFRKPGMHRKDTTGFSDK